MNFERMLKLLHNVRLSFRKNNFTGSLNVSNDRIRIFDITNICKYIQKIHAPSISTYGKVRRYTGPKHELRRNEGKTPGITASTAGRPVQRPGHKTRSLNKYRRTRSAKSRERVRFSFGKGGECPAERVRPARRRILDEFRDHVDGLDRLAFPSPATLLSVPFALILIKPFLHRISVVIEVPRQRPYFIGTRSTCNCSALPFIPAPPTWLWPILFPRARCQARVYQPPANRRTCNFH